MKDMYVKKVCFILSLVLVALSCDTMSPTPAPMNVEVNATFAERTNLFAFDFLKQLEKEEKGDNFFVSPLSLHMALGMLLNGADKDSKDELTATLKLDGLEMQLINNSYAELIDKLPQVDPNVVNKLANSVWQREGFVVEEDFKNTLKNYFKAEVFEEDFSPNTVDKINQWASDNTNAKIKKVLDQITADQVMFLMNALYFKGDWANQFDKKKTFDAPFKGVDKTAMVEMMSKRDTFALVGMDGYKALDLPYGSGNYAMRVILPDNADVPALLLNLDAEEWNAISEKMVVQKIDLQLPKFKMEYEKKLNNVLSEMGMPSLFSAEADLSKISPPAGKLVVGFVKQNSFVAVDEEGTEAAAVTTIGIDLTSLPSYPTFFVDRPFLFFIYEKSSNTIQFTGKILNLEK
ncbi:MAG: serine protease inhibitor [Algoriphagus sp.]|jgi:serine protease inhibitor